MKRNEIVKELKSFIDKKLPITEGHWKNCYYMINDINKYCSHPALYDTPSELRPIEVVHSMYDSNNEQLSWGTLGIPVEDFEKFSCKEFINKLVNFSL